MFISPAQMGKLRLRKESWDSKLKTLFLCITFYDVFLLLSYTAAGNCSDTVRRQEL